MPRSVALFDIDNTIYDGFSYFALLEKQVDEELLAQQVLGDAHAIMQKYTSKIQDYETTIVGLLDVYAAGLRGARYDRVLDSTSNFYQASDKFFPYVEPTVKGLCDSHDVSLVTGEPQFVAEAVGKLFGITSYYSSEYEVEGGVFTGTVKRYLASRHEKHDAIRHLMQGHGAENSFAFGDSEGDIEMLRAVEHAICLNPTDGLRAIAQQEGWHMPHINQVAGLVARLTVVGEDSSRPRFE